MSKTFKVGDQVKVGKGSSPYLPRNIVGSVVGIEDGTVEVDFPGWEKGHYGNSPDDTITSRFFLFDAFESGDQWSAAHLIKQRNKKDTSVTPSIATTLRLKPQAKKVLQHLEKGKSITPVEAQTVYGIYRLAASIHELKKAGYSIRAERKHDEAGHGYARYTIPSKRKLAA